MERVLHWCLGAIILALACWGVAGAQEIVNPADRRGEPKSTAQPDSLGIIAGARRVYQLPPVIVHGQRRSMLREEDRVGAYAQPRWTAHRRFGGTRVYVVPQGFFEFEYWLVPQFTEDGSSKTMVQYEAEFGLPHRLQLDLYAVSHKSGREGPMAFDEQKIELRWALADWNVLPTNPTLYLEWIGIDSAPDHMEAKLLLGGELASRWHWGTNLVFEHQMGGPQENSNEVTAGLSHTVKDAAFSVGAEGVFAFVDTREHRGNFERNFQVGPSLQCYPLPQMHLDLAPLFGITRAAPDVRVIAVVGWEF